MIVCSCAFISDSEFKRIANEIKSNPAKGVVTPGAVFRQLGKRPQCGGCFPLVVKIIHDHE